MVIELLTQAQIETLEIIEDCPGIKINQIAKKAKVPRGTIFDRISRLEAQHLIKSRKIGQEKLIYLTEDYPAEETEPVISTDTRSRLMRKFALDELDVSLLEQVTGDEPIRELPVRFKETEKQLEARIKTSIPTKFEVATGFKVATFQGAKVLFLKLMEDSTVP